MVTGEQRDDVDACDWMKEQNNSSKRATATTRQFHINDNTYFNTGSPTCQNRNRFQVVSSSDDPSMQQE